MYAFLSSSNIRSTFMRVGAAVVLLATVSACNNKPAASTAPPPPVEVAVVTIATAPLALTTELPGRIEASRIAQVRARAPGIVLKRTFREGSDVRAGDVLFKIDAAAFVSALNSSEAAVAKAEANLAQANLKLQRYEPLVKTNAVSKQEFDDVQTTQKQASADLASTKAIRNTARLNLSYATVTAPISGRIGRAQVTEGALVGQNEATPLATVQQIDTVYVNLTQSSTELLALRNALNSGKLQRIGKDQAKVNLVTEDGKVYPQAGRLLFSDLSVDESSGAILLRAEFPNPDRVLLPGMYVRARLDQAVDTQAITVPQQAVQRSPQGATVLVVGADNKIVVRPITTTGAQGNTWRIGSGLTPGEKVVVEGFQKAKPGAVVKTVQWTGSANVPAVAAVPTATGTATSPRMDASTGASAAASATASPNAAVATSANPAKPQTN